MIPKKPLPTAGLSINKIFFSHQNIYDVVNHFYKKVSEDELLKIPFASVHDWPEHIERLTHFWWARFGGEPYMFTYYNPVEKHFFAGFNESLLKRWLNLFHETLNQHLSPDQARLWRMISESMGDSLNQRNELYKEHYEKEHGRKQS